MEDSQAFTIESFEEAVRQQELPVIVDFWAIWSVACIMYKDRLKLARGILAGHALFGSVDIELVPQLTERFSIITIPTTFIFYKGQIAKQYMGIQEPETLVAAIEDITGKEIKQITEEDIE